MTSQLVSIRLQPRGILFWAELATARTGHSLAAASVDNAGAAVKRRGSSWTRPMARMLHQFALRGVKIGTPVAQRSPLPWYNQLLNHVCWPPAFRVSGHRDEPLRQRG